MAREFAAKHGAELTRAEGDKPGDDERECERTVGSEWVAWVCAPPSRDRESEKHAPYDLADATSDARRGVRDCDCDACAE
jgi:hypothetical protein